MRDFVDGSAFNFEQGQRARKLFAAVVLAALDDAIADDKKYGNGPEQIARWARSRDGREVLSCAGIDPNERVVKGLMEFVSKGVRTSVALSREESERRMAAEAGVSVDEAGFRSLMTEQRDRARQDAKSKKSGHVDASAYRELAVVTCREHLNVHRLGELRDQTVHDLLARCDGFRRPERIAKLATVCESDKRGRAGLADRPYPQAAELVRLRDAAAAVTGADIAHLELEGPAFGEALRKARIAAIGRARTLRREAD